MTIQGRLGLLRNRSSIGWLRERDIDLLLCSELHAAGALRDCFASLFATSSVLFTGAWVSHNEIDGESDLVIAFNDGEKHFILLVENKIAADFQPDQAKRYAERAARWRNDTLADVITVLVCPKEYTSRPSSELFDAVFTYEGLIDALAASQDERSSFLSVALADGIASYRRGYVAVPDASVTSVWDKVWQACSTEQPALNMERPSQKPGKSTWIYFRRPKGFSEIDTKKCFIVYKASRGQVDLQFSSMQPSELEPILADLLDDDMEVVKASKSASVRIAVPRVDFTAAEIPQHEEIYIGLRAAERLRRLFVEKRVGTRLRSAHPM